MTEIITVKSWKNYVQGRPTNETLDRLNKGWIDEEGDLCLVDSFGNDLREAFHQEFPDLMNRTFYVEFYTSGFCQTETVTTADLAEIVGRTPGYVKNVARQIPGSQKTGRGWTFERRQAVEWFKNRPKSGPKKNSEKIN